MRNQFHILNGDALKDRFPATISGQLIVCRECLVEGNVEGEELDQLFRNRAKFLSEHYKSNTQDYHEKVASEFQNIMKIENSDINLWFEDDLFCQVNFWFITYLLNKRNNGNNVYLVRPKNHTQFGFGGLNDSELFSIYHDRLVLIELDSLSRLWKTYQLNDIEKMQELVLELENTYAFMIPALKAHIQRIPQNGQLGRPIESLVKIMTELKTDDFEIVFREFSKRETIYGYGDLQVKRLYNQIKQ